MYRVLIVDDEEPALDSFTFMLQGTTDFTVIGKARSGYEALALIHEQKPELVFMDINIPGIDGLEVIEDVHQKFPGMIFILSTAYERFDLAQRAIPLGVFAYLVKPISKKTFLSSLERVREYLDVRALGGGGVPPRKRKRDFWGRRSGKLWRRATGANTGSAFPCLRIKG
jgi:two-component system response regulator YesN